MNKQQAGFTLIELVMVIVILGILAATAVPRFVNLQVDAQNAANRGIAGGIASASAINFATESLRGAAFDAVNTDPGCTDAVALALMPDYDGATYNVATVAAFPAAPVVGDVATCSVVDAAGVGAAANFTLIYVTD